MVLLFTPVTSWTRWTWAAVTIHNRGWRRETTQRGKRARSTQQQQLMEKRLNADVWSQLENKHLKVLQKSSLYFRRLSSVTIRTLSRPLTISDNDCHPLHSTFTKLRSMISSRSRLRTLSCSTDRLGESSVPGAVHLHNASLRGRGGIDFPALVGLPLHHLLTTYNKLCCLTVYWLY